MTPEHAIIVLCAVPEEFDAKELAKILLEESFAACVQVTSGVTSHYRWKGAIETSAEKLLLIKTRLDLFDKVEAAIRSRHPYEVPEIVALSLSAGHAPYLAWLAAETASPEVIGRDSRAE